MKDSEGTTSQGSSSKEKRKLAAIMFTDIHGFTRLMAKDEPGTIRMLEEQTRIMKDRIREHKGRLIKTIGDAIMADFKSAVSAVRAGIEIQKEIRKYNEDRPDRDKLLVRIGIHIGDVVIRGKDIYGDGVNVASRIETLAEPGGMCVSKYVHDQIKNFPDMNTKSLGFKTLKNVEEPIRVYQVDTGEGLVAKARTPLSREAAAAGRKPLAVMTFKNRAGDRSLDYLCEAIPSLLITNLEQSKHLSVLTWERMRDLLKVMGKEDIKSIDGDLSFELCRMDGIDTIVIGSFVKAGEMFATDAKVLDVETKRLLHTASSRGRGIDSILEMQIDELSRGISRGVGLSDSKIEAAHMRIADVTTNSMDAYNYFLRGREDYEKYYYDDARKFLEKAVQLDSTFAVAYLYLAWAYEWLHNTKARNEAYEKAKSHSQKATDKERLYIEAIYAGAIERNPDKSSHILIEMIEKYPKEKLAHYLLASYYKYKRLFDKAIEEFNKAVELDPNYGFAINGLAYTYVDIGDFDKAIEGLKRYASVSPGDANPFDSMGELYFRMGKLDEAIAQYKEALEVKSDFFDAYWRIGYIYALKENHSQAIRWADQFIARAPSSGIKAQGFLWKGFYHYWLGSLHQSLSDLSKVADLAKAIENKLWHACADWMKGWIYYDRKKIELSQRHFKSWFNLITKRYPQSVSFYTGGYNFYLGLVDLKQGQIKAAESKLAEIKSLLPQTDPSDKDSIKFYYDLLEAEVLLAKESAEKVIAVRKKAPLVRMPPDMLTWMILPYNVPFLKDVLARAYLQKGELDNAIAEYEQLLAFDPKSNERRLIHPKYYYRLAKLYEEKALPAKAIKQYKKFLEIWKDADPNIPEVEDAKKSLAKLK